MAFFSHLQWVQFQLLPFKYEALPRYFTSISKVGRSIELFPLSHELSHHSLVRRKSQIVSDALSKRVGFGCEMEGRLPLFRRMAGTQAL